MHHSVRILAVAAPLALMVALSGCSTADSGKPAASATATETEKPAEKTPAVTIGDAIGAVKGGKPVIITDEWGPYQKMTLNPDAKFFRSIPKDNDGSAKQNGFADDDILDAERWVGQFVVEQTVDSSILDSKDKKPSAWVAENRGYLTAGMLTIAEQQGDDATIVNNGLYNGKKSAEQIPARLARTSTPRASDVKVTFTTVRSVTDDGTPYLVFDGTTSTRYIADNKSVLDGYAKAGYTADKVKERFPAVDSSKPLTVLGTTTFQYAVTRNGGSWAIGGYTLTTNQDITN